MSDPSIVLAENQNDFSFDCRTECFLEEGLTEEPHIIMVAIKPDGSVETVCTLCVGDRVENPGLYDATTFYGTHILSDDALRDLFPEEYED